jgi:hypothetical protein
MKALTPTPAELGNLLKEVARGGRVVITTQAPVDHSLVAPCCLAFGLTRAEGRALVKLLQHDHVDKQTLHIAISRDDPPVTGVEVVEVVIHRLRKKLAAHDIAIKNIRGVGFFIPKDTRERVRKIIGEDSISTVAPRGEEALDE